MRNSKGESEPFACMVPTPPLDPDKVCLTLEEEELLGGRDGFVPPPQLLLTGACSRLRGVTLGSVRRAAEAADLRVTLSVIEELVEGVELTAAHEQALWGNWGRQVLYVSPAHCRLVDAPNEAAAIRGMIAAVGANLAIRSSLIGFLKLMLVGGDPSPSMFRSVIYHPDRRADLVCIWFYPLIVFSEPDVDVNVDVDVDVDVGAEDACGGGGSDDGRIPFPESGPGGAGAGAPLRPPARRPPKLGFLTFTDAAYSSARQHEGMLRDHMALKYTPNPVTMVDQEGVVVMQNAASASAIGIHGLEARLPGSPRFNYLAELFRSDPDAEEDMHRVTATGQTWSRQLRVSDSAALRKWLELRPGEERWHEVQISRLRDPLRLAPSYIVAETDVTATVLAQRQVDRLHRQQRALLRQILPQQVIDVMLEEESEEDEEAHPPPEEPDLMYPSLRSRGGSFLSPSIIVTSSPIPCSSGSTAAALAAAAATIAAATPVTAAGASSSGFELPGSSALSTPGTTPGATTTGLNTAAAMNIPAGAIAGGSGGPGAPRAAGPGADHGHACILHLVMPDGSTQPLDLRADDDDDDDDDADSGSAIQLTRRQVMSLATWHEQVTVLFADIKGFTSMSQQLHPARVMLFLDTLYNAFDLLLDECGCYKVETIGDCYMVCGGLFAQPGGPEGEEMLLGGLDPHHADKVLRFA
ncbi:hypothetical protein PLESTB_000259300 [Pleodorina starrii]|uniref:Guanylate cyclase domain-containing protein n=1 Tax=Pleodorina starrii TaxID=330485 RepID=A0A9W6BDI3_9CHLO|nr:hypothetical protein PLESTB_000259300 [Pleodorina starrii]